MASLPEVCMPVYCPVSVFTCTKLGNPPCQVSSVNEARALQSNNHATTASNLCHTNVSHSSTGRNSHLVSLDPWELLCGENAMVKTPAALNLKTVSQSDPPSDNSQTLHYVASHGIHILKLYSGRYRKPIVRELLPTCITDRH